MSQTTCNHAQGFCAEYELSAKEQQALIASEQRKQEARQAFASAFSTKEGA